MDTHPSLHDYFIQVLDGDTTTISISSWMELPKLPFHDWESMQKEDIKHNYNNYRMPKRVKIKHVAQYYNDYVERMRLSKNFRNFSFVTSLKRIKSKSCVSMRKFRSFWMIEHSSSTIGILIVRFISIICSTRICYVIISTWRI